MQRMSACLPACLPSPTVCIFYVIPEVKDINMQAIQPTLYLHQHLLSILVENVFGHGQFNPP